MNEDEARKIYLRICGIEENLDKIREVLAKTKSEVEKELKVVHDKRRIVFETIKELHRHSGGEPVSIEEIINVCKQKGVGKRFTLKDIVDCRKRGELYEAEKGKIRFTLGAD